MKLSKRPITVICILCIMVFALGYYVAERRCGKSDTSKVVVDSTTTKKETKVKVIKAPDGTETTETTVTDEVKDVTSVKERVLESKASSSQIHIQALAGIDTTDNFTPVYGAAISKDLIGPVSVGVFGLTNGVYGVTLGVSF